MLLQSVVKIKPRSSVFHPSKHFIPSFLSVLHDLRIKTKRSRAGPVARQTAHITRGLSDCSRYLPCHFHGAGSRVMSMPTITNISHWGQISWRVNIQTAVPSYTTLYDLPIALATTAYLLRVPLQPGSKKEDLGSHGNSRKSCRGGNSLGKCVLDVI